MSAAEIRLLESGVAKHKILFGPLSRALDRIADAIRPKRLWILLDEWSSIPIELQPLLADLIRRSLFPVRGITVKIAAIERRSQFRVLTESGDYVGIEIGADASAGLNLDDYMIFDNDRDLAGEFFSSLLYKHALVQLHGVEDRA